MAHLPIGRSALSHRPTQVHGRRRLHPQYVSGEAGYDNGYRQRERERRFPQPCCCNRHHACDDLEKEGRVARSFVVEANRADVSDDGEEQQAHSENRQPSFVQLGDARCGENEGQPENAPPDNGDHILEDLDLVVLAHHDARVDSGHVRGSP